MFDKQAALRDAADGIRGQGGPSVLHGTIRCRYRDAAGNRCAVGWLIPDDQYDPRIEENNVVVDDDVVADRLDSKYGSVEDGMLQQNLVFLTDLQFCHDDAVNHTYVGVYVPLDNRKFMKRFEKNVRALAKKYGLKPV
jgi:hypothetical protein